MTLTYSKAKIIYDGNGMNNRWDIPFAFLNAEDIDVYILDGGDKQQLLSSDYVFDALNHAIIYPHPDGESPRLPAGKQLLILRRTPLTQQTSFGAQEHFDPAVLERAYDKAMMIAQEHAERLERTVTFPASAVSASTDADAYLRQLQQAKENAEQADQSAQESLSQAAAAAQTAQQASVQALEAVSGLQNYVNTAQEAQSQAIAAQSAAQESALSAAQSAQGAQDASSLAVSSAMQVQEAAGVIQSQVLTTQTAAGNAQAAANAVQAWQAQTAVDAQTASAAAAQAHAWAVKTDGAVENGNYSSKYYAQQAKVNLPLLTSLWSDHLLDNISWLRADTFSWHSGDVYSAVYNELLSAWGDWWQTHTAADLELENGVYFARTERGYKICHADEDSSGRLQNAYNTAGAAWIYCIDTDNRRFKLPRTKFGFTGLRTAVGDYVAPGLPNLTGTADLYKGGWGGSGTADGVFSLSTGDTNGHGASNNGSSTKITFNASAGNQIYGASDTVQPPATQMYLYFYAGDFTPSALEQTAGLNAELFNGKQDVLGNNVDYVVNSYTDADGNWYRVYKSGWLEQGGNVHIASEGQNLTFLRAFANTDYSFTCSGGTKTFGNVAFYNRTATGGQVWTSDDTSFNAGLMSWMACGRGA